MVDFMDLKGAFGEEILSNVGQQLVVKGAKALTMAAQDSEDVGRTFLDVSSVFDGAEGMSHRILAPSNFEDAPTLFMTIPFKGVNIPTPFLQVGTVAGIETPFLRIAMDMILDPINLASFGTAGAGARVGAKLVEAGLKGAAKGGVRGAVGKAVGATGRFLEKGITSGLTPAGQMRRAVSTLLDNAGKGHTGAKLVEQMNNAITLAAKVRGAGLADDVVKAAQAGDAKALKNLFTEAIKSGKLAPEEAHLLSQLNRDSKALAKMFERTGLLEETAELGADFFLQATSKELLAGGPGLRAVNPLISFAKLANPARHPGAFTRQMLGFSYRDERTIVPASDLVADGLDLFLRPKAVLPEGLRLKPKLDALADARKWMPGDPTFFDARAAFDPLLVLTSSPTARRSVLFNPETLGQEKLWSDYKQIMGPAMDPELKLSKAGKKTQAAFGKFVDDAVRRANDALRAQDQQVARRISDLVEAGSRRIESAADTLPFERAGQQLRNAETGELLDAGKELVKTRQEQLRRVADLFTLDSIQSDGFGMGHGFAARANMVSSLGNNLRGITEHIVVRNYGRKNAGIVQEVMPRIVEHLDEFFHIADDGFLRLKPGMTVDMLAGESDFLLDMVTRGKGDFLRDLLEVKGLAPEMAGMVDMMRESFHAIGENLFENEGILKHLFANYFPRKFKPAPAFFKRFKTSRTRQGEFAQSVFDSMEAFETFLDEFGVKLEHLAEGKIGFNQVRKATEELALKMEKAGLGTYVRDATSSWVGYMDSANKALMVNTLVRELPRIAPRITREMLTEAEQKLFKDVDMKGLSLVMDIADVPAQAKELFEIIDVFPRAVPHHLNRKVIANKAIAETIAGLDLSNVDVAHVPRVAREKVAAKLAGQKNISRFNVGENQFVNLKYKKGGVAEFNPKWVTGKAKWPLKSVSGARELKAHVDKLVEAAEDVARATTRARAETAQAQKLGQAAKRIAKAAEKPETLPTQVAVYKGAARPLQEAFRLFAHGGKVSTLGRLYDDFNYRMKSIVLMGDVFHYNVLAFNQVIADPTAALRNLRDSAGTLLPGVAEGVGLNATRGAVVGAASGAVAGAGLGDGDIEDVLTGALVGGIYGAMIGSSRQNAMHTMRQNMLNPDSADTLMWMGLGGWTGRPDDRAIGFMTDFLQNQVIKSERATGGLRPFLVSPLTGLAHISEAWDKELWELMHNGSKHFYFTERWGQLLPALEQSRLYSTKHLITEFNEAKRGGKLDDLTMSLDRARKETVPLSPRKTQTAAEDEFFVLVDDTLSTGRARVPPHLQGTKTGHVMSDVPDYRALEAVYEGIEVPLGEGIDPRMRKYIANRRFELKRQLAAEIMQSSNNIFGGQSFKNLIGDPSHQFMLRRFLLAPDWTLSRLNMASTMFMNMGPMKSALMGAGMGSLLELAEAGFDQDSPPWRGVIFGAGLGAAGAKWANFTARAMRTPGHTLAREARRRTAAAMVGGYVFSTLANKGFTGRYMHENEEGKRLSIELPGTDGIGRPRFVTLGKQWKEFGEFGAFLGKEQYPVPVVSRLASKMAVPARFGIDVLTNLNYRSGDYLSPIFLTTDEPWEIAHKGVRFTLARITPIMAAGPLQATFGALEEAVGGEAAASTFGEAAVRGAGFQVSKSHELGGRVGISSDTLQAFLDSL